MLNCLFLYRFDLHRNWFWFGLLLLTSVMYKPWFRPVFYSWWWTVARISRRPHKDLLAVVFVIFFSAALVLVSKKKTFFCTFWYVAVHKKSQTRFYLNSFFVRYTGKNMYLKLKTINTFMEWKGFSKIIDQNIISVEFSLCQKIDLMHTLYHLFKSRLHLARQ